MAVRPILRWPDPVLAQVCTAVGPIDPGVGALAADLLETMYAANGRGLAAPQVGVLRRVFVMDIAWKQGTPAPLVLIDPVMEWRSEAQVGSAEGCLSIPGIVADVQRAAAVRVGWTGLDGDRRVETLTGVEAICAQHELDHLDGIVTLDRVDAATRALLETEYTG